MGQIRNKNNFACSRSYDTEKTQHKRNFKAMIKGRESLRQIEEIANDYSLGYPEETLKEKFEYKTIRAITKRLKNYYGTTIAQKMTRKRVAARARYTRYCALVRQISFEEFVQLEKCFTARTARQLILQIQAEQLYDEMRYLRENKHLTDDAKDGMCNALKLKIINVENEIEAEMKKECLKQRRKAS
jgi:hypothetical protein